MSNCAPKLGQTAGLFAKPARHCARVFLHCSAASRKSIDAEEIDSWHTEGNGWSCIGYHYFIKTDGEVQCGRDIERTPAAQGGNNTGTIAICLNGLEPDDFTEAQYSAVKDLCEQINAAYDGNITFHGHREVAAKECPVFPYIDILDLDDRGAMT